VISERTSASSRKYTFGRTCFGSTSSVATRKFEAAIHGGQSTRRSTSPRLGLDAAQTSTTGRSLRAMSKPKRKISRDDGGYDVGAGTLFATNQNSCET